MKVLRHFLKKDKGYLKEINIVVKQKNYYDLVKIFFNQFV